MINLPISYYILIYFYLFDVCTFMITPTKRWWLIHNFGDLFKYSVVEPSTKTTLIKVSTFYKIIRFQRTCLFFKTRRMSCHIEHFSDHFECTFDIKYAKMTLPEFLPNINSCVFFHE